MVADNEIWFYLLAGVLAYIAAKRINAITGLLLAICAVVFAILKTRFLVFWILGACVSAARIDVRFKTPLALAGTFLALVGWVLNQLTMNSRSLPVFVHLPSVVAESFMAIGVVISVIRKYH